MKIFLQSLILSCLFILIIIIFFMSDLIYLLLLERLIFDWTQT